MELVGKGELVVIIRSESCLTSYVNFFVHMCCSSKLITRYMLQWILVPVSLYTFLLFGIFFFSFAEDAYTQLRVHKDKLSVSLSTKV